MIFGSQDMSSLLLGCVHSCVLLVDRAKKEIYMFITIFTSVSICIETEKFICYLPFLSNISRFVLLSLSIVLTPFPFVLTVRFNILTYLIRLLYVTKVTLLLSSPHAAALLPAQAPASLPGPHLSRLVSDILFCYDPPPHHGRT